MNDRNYLDYKLQGRKTFKVNEFITLGLDHTREKTKIYVGIKEFKVVLDMILVMHKSKDEMYVFDNIKSVDDINDRLSHLEILNNYRVSTGELPHIYYYKGYFDREEFERDISLEEEFQAYCSIFQAWDENDYNTELMYREIAFPLLYELVEEGDEKAKKVFTKEISKRFRDGSCEVKKYLFYHGYLRRLPREDLWSLFPMFGSILNEIEQELSNKFKLGNRGSPKLIRKPLIWFDMYGNYLTREDSISLGIHYYVHLSISDWNSLFDKLSTIQELEMLDLSYNDLRSVPAQICKLISLRTLRLATEGGKSIVKLPQCIKKKLPYVIIIQD